MKTILITLITATMFMSSCKKNDWLDVKSNKADVVPKTLKDMQALLDNEVLMNNNAVALPVIGSDNYYVTYANWQARPIAAERNAYVYNPEIFEGAMCFDWTAAYSMIAQANVVLEGLQKITPGAGEQLLYDQVKGRALFFRAAVYYDLVQTFAKQYDVATAMNDPGVPLKLAADVNIVVQRSSVAATYEQVISDLVQASALLPNTETILTRPSKAAAKGLLARVYLCMGKYTESLAAATEALAIYNTLTDLNTISTAAANAFAAYPNNKEVIWYNTATPYGILGNTRILVDTSLYKSYVNNDLRKTVFYKDNGVNGIAFKGDYTGMNAKFAGIAVNELYMIKAECEARAGQPVAAMATLNSLLQKRWKSGLFVPFVAATPAAALNIILTERRKELPFTGILRWTDLRRLNKEPQYAVTLQRVLNGVTYTLPPGDNRYVYPIPPDEIRLSGIEQNPR